MAIIWKWSLNGNTNDSAWTNNGTPTVLTYVDWKNGEAGSFNWTTTWITWIWSNLNVWADFSIRQWVKYNNITSLYLAILYPDALDAEPCYALYSKPSIQYKMNAGLDEDKDGKVTVQDIDKRLKRMYPTACKATIKDEGKTNIFSGW